MPFDPVSTAERYAREAQTPLPTPEGGWPAGAPAHEYTRSPAAARVGRLAARDGLFLFHYEHAAWRELPEDWVPAERPDLADVPAWEGGVLAERKYQSFRHDQPIGGFHPGQRAKWTTHELCHSLVGFAWKPGASPFFLATAGRLAELLPVTLWYWLDEAHLRRCEAHEHDPALFRAFCPDCDAIAAPRPSDPDAGQRLSEGKRFFERELAAIARSRAAGRPLPNPWASLDLASDGVAYAGAHAARLHSRAFQAYAERFLVEGGGWSPTLDALEERVVAVLRGITGEAEPPPLAPSAAHGAWRWRLQDLGWRLLSVWHDTGGDASRALMDVVEILAAAIPATTRAGDPSAQQAVDRAIAAYGALADEFVLPPASEIFSAGWPVARGAGVPVGLGSSVEALGEGIRSATPLVADWLGDDLEPRVAAFAAHDLAAPTRELLGTRWSRWLGAGPLGDLARFEAALAAPGSGDADAVALGGVGRDERVRLARGLAVHRFGVDVVALAEQVEGADRIEVEDRPTALVIGRLGGGDVAVVDVSTEAADALERLGPGGGIPEMPAAEARALKELGLLVPAAWLD
jgi:hypothetical protein